MVVGFSAGALIGMTIVLASMFFFMEYVMDFFFILAIAAVIGGVTGGIFAPITSLFIRDMDSRKVLVCLTAATLFFGVAPSVVLWMRSGSHFPILNWPSGMLGYWIAFVFRKELVWLYDWLEAKGMWSHNETR